MGESKKQRLIYDVSELEEYIAEFENVFLVCGDSSLKHCAGSVIRAFERSGIDYVRFGDFTPNPDTKELEEAFNLFGSRHFDAIVAIGGGSAMDIVKCIKFHSGDIPLLVMPTTAGSGSEATSFAVIYKDGIKQSIESGKIIPDAVFFDSGVLNTLPIYQKKSTVLDALCHCIESFWSVNSTDESRKYAKEGMKLILNNIDAYISRDDEANPVMQKASYLAGRAINISKTTAGHAMSYKLTGLYGCAHGHAVALCIRKLWPWMLDNIDKCTDPRGSKYLSEVFNELTEIMGCCNDHEAAKKFDNLFDSMDLEIPTMKTSDVDILINSVNIDRLNNNPIGLSKNDLEYLYRQI